MKPVLFFLLLSTSNPISATADFQVSLDLQWDYCSGLLTLICNHSSAVTDPFWIYNGSSASGVALEEIPGAKYTEATQTRHVAVISGMENVTAVDSFSFQCVYHLLNGFQAQSNAKQYYWGYAEENSYVDYGTSSCFYNCTVESSMAPQCHNYTNISVTASPSTSNQSIPTSNGVNYTISDLQRCQRYTVEVTAQVGAHKYTNRTQVTVTLGPGRAEIMNVILFAGEVVSQLKVLLRKSEDDCAGHETTRYTFFIGDREVGNMTADMPGLRSLSKKGDVAEVTFSVPTYITNSSLFILTVVLSNTVEFTEVITSSSYGVSSALRSNSWYTTSDPHYYQCSTATDVCRCNSSFAQGIAGVASIMTLVLVAGVCLAFIMGWWLGRRKMKKGLDESKSLRNTPQNAAYDVPSSTMQTNPAYMTLEACMTAK